MKKKIIFVALMAVVVGLLIALMTSAAFAGTAKYGWEKGADEFSKSLTGPMAFYFSLFMIFGAGLAILLGGDMTGWVRAMLIVVLVVGLIGSAKDVLGGFFGISALAIM